MVNRHFDTANISEYNYSHNYGDYRLTQATLALAYEQRTANLIAYRNGDKILLRDVEPVMQEIRKRLDLPE